MPYKTFVRDIKDIKIILMAAKYEWHEILMHEIIAFIIRENQAFAQTKSAQLN